MKNIILSLTFVLSALIVFSQSRKEIIETLNIRIDSLNGEIKKRDLKYEQEVLTNTKYIETLKNELRKEEQDLDSIQNINIGLNKNNFKLQKELDILNDSISEINSRLEIFKVSDYENTPLDLQQIQQKQDITLLRPADIIEDYIINDIIKFYSKKYIEGSKLEVLRTDSFITLFFRNLPTKENDFNDEINIERTIPIIKSLYVSGDINNDKKDDLITDVFYVGDNGGNWYGRELIIIVSDNDKYRLNHIYESGGICGCKTSEYNGIFAVEKIQDGIIYGQSVCWSDTDAHCCPSLYYESAIKYDNSTLKFVSKKIITWN